MEREKIILPPSGLVDCASVKEIEVEHEDRDQLDSIRQQFYIRGTEDRFDSRYVFVPVFVPETGLWHAHRSTVTLRRPDHSKNIYRITINCADNTPWDHQQHVYPVASNMTTDIVNGAKYHVLKTDVGGYIYTKGTQGRHRDYELLLMATLEGIMQPFLRQHHVDMINEVEGAKTKFVALSKFYGDVLNEVVKFHRARHIGYYTDQGLDGHLHAAIKNAVLRMRFHLYALDKERYRETEPYITYLVNALNIPDAKYPWELESDD